MAPFESNHGLWPREADDQILFQWLYFALLVIFLFWITMVVIASFNNHIFRRRFRQELDAEQGGLAGNNEMKWTSR